MRTTTSLVLGLLLIHLGQAVKFSGVKVKLGKAKCTCDITVIPKEPCTGKAKCDKKCSGKGGVELDGFTVDLMCRKGKCTVSNCEAEVEVTEAPTGSGSEPGPLPGSGSEPPMPITGSGSEPPMPITGSGSGEQPVPITGLGSGEQPVPITGSGSGPEPFPITGSGSGPVPLPPTGSGSGMPPTGSSMPCSCQCSCPEGGGACDCDCNCPVRSPQITCGSGFTKVCPMVEGTRCPDMMVAVCPGMGMELTRSSMDRMSHEGEGCQCVPDFLLAMVPGMPPPGTIVAGRLAYSPEALNRAPEKASIMFGKKKCKCTVDCKCTKESCARSKITCDKKCSGTAKAVPVEGCGVVDAKAVKGKVKISKCTCGGEEPTGTGSGSGPAPLPITGSGSGPGPLPITGSGSGPMPLPPTGSGSGSGPEPITGPRPACACVGVM